MKQYRWKMKMISCGMAFAMLLALSACGQSKAPSEETPPDSPAQTPVESPETPLSEREVSDTMLLEGKETQVFLDISDGEITFWDQASGGTLLAVAKYPQEIPGAAEALSECDFTDLDGDGNSDFAAWFRFEDGSTASLMWFFADGGFVYNEDFSQLPGSASGGA